MTRPRLLIVEHRAAHEIDDAAAWWHENRPASPLLFEHEIGRAFSMLRELPGEPGVPVYGAGLRAGVRRLFLARVGYHVYYQADHEQNRVAVLSIWHARREAPVL